MAWLRDQRTICPTCRTRKEEWAHDRNAFVGDIQQCPGCDVLEQEQENAREMKARGLKVGLVPQALASTGEELGG